MEGIDGRSSFAEIRRIIEGKPSLKRFYLEAYKKFADSLKLCPEEGLALELGSGAGFAKKVIAQLIISDIVPYEGNDCVLDATKFPFKDDSLRFICMMNTFHHIPDVGSFLAEAERCLVRGGRILLVDQHPGFISTPILKYMHSEPFSLDAKGWKFESTGPLSGANGALAWIVFVRDFERFKQRFSLLKVVKFTPHSPLRYWLAGGLESWCLLPGWAYALATALDRILVAISPRFASFVDIEIVRQ